MPGDKHALFIEPCAALRDLLLAAKARVAAWRPAQVYCDHPPHCTLLAGAYHPPGAWLPELRRRLAACPPVDLRVAGWLVFPDDVAAGGGHTVTLAVTPAPELFRLQMAVAEVLGPHQVPGPNPWTSEPMATSQRRFGFPFVGAHWRPHFTVASLATARNDPFLPALTAPVPDFAWTLREVGLWRITDDGHTMMERIPLAHPR